jgi:hypothetical protein
MSKPAGDLAAVYDAWLKSLKDNNDLIENDGRLPEGTRVWTPFGEQDLHDNPSTYCAPNWGWYQGTILGQAEPQWWFVFCGYDNLPKFCMRHFSELRIVTQAD